MTKSELDQVFNRYIQLSSKIRVLSSPNVEKIKSGTQYQQQLHKNFEKIRELSEEKNYIYKAYFNKILNKKGLLTKTEATALKSFSKSLFNAKKMEDVDIPLCYQITEKQLDDAYQKNDIKDIIYALDQKVEASFAMMYLAHRLDNCDNTCYIYRDQGIKAAKEIIKYLQKKKFASLPDDETKHLVLINSRYICALYHRSDKYGDESINEEDIATLRKSLALADDKFYREEAPNYNWDYHRFRTLEYFDSLTELNNIRGFNKKQLKELLGYHEELMDLWEKNEEIFSNYSPRVVLKLYEARIYYLNGLVSLQKYKELLRSIIGKRKSNILSLHDNVTNLLAVSEYISVIDHKKANEEDIKHIRNYYAGIIRYLYHMPNEGSFSSTISYLVGLLNGYIDIDNENNDFEELLLSIISAFNPPTFVHSLTVSDIAQLLTKELLKKEPERFIGFNNYKTVKTVLNHQKDIIYFANHSSLCHDFGKIFVIEFIMTYGRSLMPIEFSLIKTHPVVGSEILLKHKPTAKYANIAKFHHRFYNMKGGYPEEDYSKLPERIIIDIISVADCLDAATDDVGRSYKQSKTLEEVIQEFRDGSGTRYAPYVVALFDDPKVIKALQNIITKEREKNYKKVYEMVLKYS